MKRLLSVIRWLCTKSWLICSLVIAGAVVADGVDPWLVMYILGMPALAYWDGNVDRRTKPLVERDELRDALDALVARVHEVANDLDDGKSIFDDRPRDANRLRETALMAFKVLMKRRP